MDREAFWGDIILELKGLRWEVESLKAERDSLKALQSSLARERDFSERLMRSLPCITYLFDPSGGFIRCNENFKTVTGYSEEELSSLRPLEILAPRDRETGRKKIAEVVEKGEAGMEAALLTKDGVEIPCYFTEVRLDTPDGVRLIGTAIDISERKRAEESLREAFKRLEGLNASLKAANTDLAVLYSISSTLTRALGVKELLKKAIEAIAGFALPLSERRGAIFIKEGGVITMAAEVGGSLWFGPDGECRSDLDQAIEDLVNAGGSEGLRVVACGGSTPHGHILMPLRSIDEVFGAVCLYLPGGARPDERMIRLLESVAGQLGVAVNNARTFEKMKELTLKDQLTGLANRRRMFGELDANLSRAYRYGRPYSVMMSDIDDFKVYNDTRGHLAGDRLLKGLAGIFASNTRGSDVAARFGGEEFLVILPETELSEALVAAEKLRERIESETEVTISIGVASFEAGMTNDDLIKKADEAMYRAKALGKNRVEA